MPIVGGKYVAPSWANDAPPPINATELLALSQSVESIDESMDATVPTGSIFWLASQTIPTGYLKCDGSAISKTDYPSLYAVIGNSFGESGNNFNLPNMSAKFVRAAGSQDGYSATFGNSKYATNVNMYSTKSWGTILSDVADADRIQNIGSMDNMMSGNVKSTINLGSAWFRPYNIALTPIIKY